MRRDEFKKLKNSALVIAVAALLVFVGLFTPSKGGCDPAATVAIEGSIRISGPWALYPMVVKWAEEFKRIHPKVRIDISAGGAGKAFS